MKRKTIFWVALVMGCSFIALLYLQYQYVDEVIDVRKRQFDETVNRSLYETAHNLEMNMLQRSVMVQLLDHQVQPENRIKRLKLDSTLYAALDLNRWEHPDSWHAIPDGVPRASNFGSIDSLLYSYSNPIICEPLRLKIQNIDSELGHSLIQNGLDIKELEYHFYITNAMGDTIYKCPDYRTTGSQITYSQVLFGKGPSSQAGTLYVHFPQVQYYLYSGIRFIGPTILFTSILLFVFIFTLYMFIHQKRLSEMKNDFINNMTHELKTPISSISLAVQMLRDPDMQLNENAMKRIVNVVTDETRRLRFLVEKVLQMSMFDKKGGTFKFGEKDVAKIVSEVAATFRLKVESVGGTLHTEIPPNTELAMIDEMHFTNVIFNLLDNAVKYRSPVRPLQLNMTCKNDDKYIYIKIEDNGIGIKSSDLKKIFDKFYRSHTGNKHDIKGFGLGLAYVRKVVLHHKGVITANSTIGVGTSFLIKIPNIKNKQINNI